MLEPGDPAPDFAVGKRTLHQMLDKRAVALFFYPKAFGVG
jgi:peroxiredoxin